MILLRLFEPTATDVVYHYCTAATFKAILETGTIRFSDINMLNDAQELQWGYSVFEEAAGKLLGIVEFNPRLKGLDKSFLDKVDAIIGPMQMHMHPFVSCFSKDGDLLSQWRAYANDAEGFAIGFYAKCLEHMPASLLTVEYERERQVNEMMRALAACYAEDQESDKGIASTFGTRCALIGSFMAAFKNTAFREEQEVRCLHLVDVEIQERSIKLSDYGGSLGGKDEVAGEKIQFRTESGALIAFLDMPFRRGFGGNEIKEIVLGPKNPNAPANVLYFLGNHGYEGAAIRCSTCPYR